MILMFTLPIFQVDDINFEGGEKYSQEEIMSMAEISNGMNVFMIRPNHIKRLLEKEEYIKSATVDLKYPNQLSISIKERKVRGYIPYTTGTYLYIDEDGRVLNSDTSYKEQLPLVDGLDFDEFHIGEILKVKNEKSFDVVLKTANMMIKYDFIDEVVKIDVTDSENIKLYIKHITVLLGNLTDYDYKIRTMLEIIKEIPEKNRGFLNLKDANKPPIFSLLT